MFGPGYDPAGPPPTEPVTNGPGITTLTVTAAGPADIEQLRTAGETAPRYEAVVVAVRIPAASTTPVLGATSVLAKSEDGTMTPVAAICAPTAEPPLVIHHGAGARISRWNVAVGGKTYECGGRNARLAVTLGEGGLRAITTSAWDGPMILFFPRPASAIRRVVVAGVEAELPPRDKDPEKKN